MSRHSMQDWAMRYLLDLSVGAFHEVLLQLDGELDVLVLAQVHWDQLQFCERSSTSVGTQQGDRGRRAKEQGQSERFFADVTPSAKRCRERTSMELCDLALG
jgi:hypothetical protein